MRFRCKVYDRSGAAKEQVIDAGSPAEASELLRRDGYFVASVSPADEAARAAQRQDAGRRPRGGKHRHISGFMRQFAVLVATGTPVVDALQALENQSRDPGWRAVVADVRRRVEDGGQLSDAMAAQPRYFDTVCRSLVRAGESGGKLDVMLNRLAELTRQQLKIRQTLVGAMIYPGLLIGVSVIVLCVMLCFVMPRFAGLFKTMDVPLPPTTKFMMAVSGFMVSYWWAVLFSLAAGGTGLVLWLGSAAGKRAIDTLLLAAPYIGRICRSLYTARFARLVGLLMESKVPMLECLDLTRQASANHHYAELMTRTERALTQGETFSAALASSDLITGSVIEAVKNGERTGQVGVVLSSLADFLDEENQVLIKAMTGLIEPLILITLGIVVGLVATSMFLPLFDLTAMAGGG